VVHVCAASPLLARNRSQRSWSAATRACPICVLVQITASVIVDGEASITFRSSMCVFLWSSSSAACRSWPRSPGSAPYLVAILNFDSMADLSAALASPEGQAAAADLPNFASGGATLLIYDCKAV
jgi:hypothetical protein